MYAPMGPILIPVHVSAATGPGMDEHGTPEVLLANAREDFSQVRPFVGRTLRAETWAMINCSVMLFVARHRALFERHVAEARIRDGRDDLSDFYICYRAFARGKVESFKLEELELPDEERAMATERADEYFRLAEKYAARMLQHLHFDRCEYCADIESISDTDASRGPLEEARNEGRRARCGRRVISLRSG